LRDGKEGSELHIMELATGISRRVSQTPALKVEPAWSPDGTRIVFHRSDSAHNPGLTILELASGRETLLTSGSYASPAWSLDGQWIAASGTGAQGKGLYLFDVTSLQAKRISEMSSYEAAPIWASDSRSLQILVDERKRSALLTLNLEGSQLSRLEIEFNPDPSFWGIFLVKPTPNGFVYLQQRVEGDIYMAENPTHGR
jgi:TolB protein